MMADLFKAQEGPLSLAPGAVLMKGYAENDRALLDAVSLVAAQSPFRHMTTMRGFKMSVAMTCCGELGWVSDRKGYRYDPIDPETAQPWPRMPEVFLRLAQDAAREAGYPDFSPDAMLINRYVAGAKLSLHQDKDEGDLAAPIVSVSLGLPATFIFGGLEREDAKKKMTLGHGDVVVWGGPSRLAYHGILPLKDGGHPLTGKARINLTFRKVRYG